MRRSCACVSLAACLAAALTSEAGEPVGRPHARALVLPTRLSVGAPVDAGKLDLVMATATQEVGLEVVEPGDVVSEALDRDRSVAEARQSYLDMDFDTALSRLSAVRQAEISAGAELLATRRLLEAELLMIQVLLDMGRGREAAELAERILERHPTLRLDPAEYPPAMQSLWTAAVDSRANSPPPELDPATLAALGRRLGVDWVFSASWLETPGSQGKLSILVVPTAEGADASHHEVALGPTPTWGASARDALRERFPEPRTPQEALTPTEERPSTPAAVAETPWYESWWFWTVVGVVVAGGVAGGVGGYYATREDEPATVTWDPW